MGQYSDTIENIFGPARQAAQTAVVSDSDAEPDNAGRAMEISQATGVPPSVVYSSLDQFEAQHKQKLASGIVQGNPHLVDYVNSSPMAAKVSNDDWGTLDSISQKLAPFARGAKAVMQAAVEGFKQYHGESVGLPQEELDKVKNLTNASPQMVSLLNRILLRTPLGQSYEAQNLLQGMAGALSTGAGELGRQLGYPNAPDFAEKALQAAFDPGLAASLGPAGEALGPVDIAMHNKMLKGAVKAITDSAGKVEPYVANGKVPPVGLDELTDQGHAEQAKLDGKNLQDLFSEVQQSTTKERAPEMLAQFIGQHTDAHIGVDLEGIDKLFGEDYAPKPGDNKLGWVPEIAEQMDLARAGGGDVNIPLVDWLVKADPEVAKKLHDFIRVRPEGMTIDEGKGAGPKVMAAEEPKLEGEEAALPSPIDSIRAAAKLSIPEAVDEGIVPSSTIQGEVTDQGITAHALHAFSAKDAMAMVDKDRLSGVPRALAELFGDRLARLAGDTGIHVVSEEDMRKLNVANGIDPEAPAYYNPNTNQIIMREDIANGDFGHNASAHVLIHETAHAATTDALYHYPQLKSVVTSMMSETSGYLDQVDKASRLLHNYAFKNEDEFIAEAFSNPRFQEVLSTTPISKELARRLALDKPSPSVWDAVKNIVKDLIEQLTGVRMPDTMMDGVLRLGEVFEKIKGDEVAKERRGAKGAEPIDQSIFTRATALGMNKARLQQYMELIAKQREEDAAYHAGVAEKSERERQTKEWKENEAAVRKEATAAVKSRPDIAADRLLREGELYGEKVRKPRLREDALTPEQAAVLPEEFLGKKGMHPDDLAGLFGYHSGHTLVDSLAKVQEERGLEGLTPAAHFSKLVDAETERRMKRQYGNLEDNILEGAKDHVISQTQIDIIAQEVYALAEKNKATLPISPDNMKSWVKEQFNGTSVGAHSTDKYLAQAGRAGADAEEALLEERPSDALKAKQQQHVAMLLANEAKKLEKEKGSFERIAKRFAKREVTGVLPEYTNFIHDILIRTGNLVRRSVQDLEREIEASGYKDLENFVSVKEGELRELPVADFLYDSTWRKPVEQMTVDEFRAVHDSLKALQKNGRDELKIYSAGAERDLKEVKGEMIEELKTFPQRRSEFNQGKAGKFKSKLQTYLAEHLQLESLFNRWDRGDPGGVWTQYVMRDLATAANEKDAVIREFSNKVRGLADDVDIHERIPNNLFRDPDTGEPLPLTRKNLRAILMNAGNASNLDKLARGFKILTTVERGGKTITVGDTAKIMQWLHQFATKKDWDFAQGLGNLFAELKERSDRMVRNLADVPAQDVRKDPIQTPHGTYDGWYYPIIYDKRWEGSSKKLMGPDPLEQSNYIRASTPQGYTKSRTGYAAPIELDLDSMPGRMKSIIHDLTMRPAVINASKIFYDREVRSAISNHYGKAYRDLLIPYLRDVANASNYISEAQKVGSQVSEFFRQNTIAMLIGFNPRTVAKHGMTALVQSVNQVGTKEFAKAVKSLFSVNEDTGDRNFTFAMKESQELQRRHRNYRESLSGAHDEVIGQPTSWRQALIQAGATPVAFSDLMSAVPTWLAKYETASRDGLPHGDAVYEADRAVRRAHGSSVMTNRPGVVRNWNPWFTSLYGFFSHILNRQYELAWRAKDTLGMAKEGELGAAMKEIPALSRMTFAYILFPAMVESMITPIPGEDHTPWGIRAAKAIAFDLASSWPGVRDIVSAWAAGRDPSAGLIGTGFKTITDTARDFGKGQMTFSREHAGVLLKHGFQLFGTLTGLTNAQEGKMAEFLHNWYRGKERPRGAMDIWKGLSTGTTKERK